MGERPPLGVLLVGSGSIAAYHLAGLAAAAGACVRAIASRNRATAKALADRFAIAEVVTDIEAAMARADIDAVVIATPDDTHEALATRAAAAGKSILLQKPMAPDVAACQRIIAAAESAQIDLQVSFMHRYFEEVAAARQLIADGVIGRVESIRIRNATPGPDWKDWFFDPDKVAGGVIHQLGVHGIDLVLHLFGPIASVAASHAIMRPRRRLSDGREVWVTTPDSAWATYQLASGAIASHEMSMIEAAGTDRFRLEIYGSEGTIWLRTENGALAVHASRLGERWQAPALPTPPFGQRHHQHWIDGLAGKAAPAQTADDALRGMEVAEAILRSAAEGGRLCPVSR